MITSGVDLVNMVRFDRDDVIDDVERLSKSPIERERPIRKPARFIGERCQQIERLTMSNRLDKTRVDDLLCVRGWEGIETQRR